MHQFCPFLCYLSIAVTSAALVFEHHRQPLFQIWIRTADRLTSIETTISLPN